MKKKKKLSFKKWLLIGVAGFFALIIVAWSAGNVIKFAIYSDFYAIRTTLADSPGKNDGFVVQGTCYLEEEKVYLSSGYMNSAKPSRIYVSEANGASAYVELFDNVGEAFDGHCGGIASEGGNVYIANGSAVHLFDLADILDGDGQAAETMEVSLENNRSSFVFSTPSALYVGEFHDADNGYDTNNAYHNERDGKDYYALVKEYLLSSVDLGVPVLLREFAIGEQIQGFCITDSGKMVLSRSYGLANSHFYIYLDPTENSDPVLDGVHPLYFLDDSLLEQDIKAPPMMEDLDYADGKVIVQSESASNKYFFGKLFFYNYIEGLAIA